jgi:ABC-type Mn2+/Zn2+ transport system permease subunit
MRTFFRAVINGILILAAIGAVGWVTTLKAYHTATPGTQHAMLIGTAAGAFVIACVVLAVIKPKKKTATRTPGYTYGTAKRR